jgi:hypothetical protein
VRGPQASENIHPWLVKERLGLHHFGRVWDEATDEAVCS